MFCPCVLCVILIGLYVPYVMRCHCCFSDLKIFEVNFGIPLAPQVHTLQYHDHSRYCWIRLIPNNLFVAKSAAAIKVISIDWARVITVWLFLVKFPILTPTSMLSHHGQLGVAIAFPPNLFPVLLHAYEPYMVRSLMYEGLVSTGPTSYRTSHSTTIFNLDTAIHACNVHSNMLRLVTQNLTRHIHKLMHSTNPWIHLLNELIYNRKSPISDNWL